MTRENIRHYLFQIIDGFTNLPAIRWRTVWVLGLVWFSLFTLRSSWTVEDTILSSTLIPNMLEGRGVDLSSIPFGLDLQRPDDLCFVHDAYGRTLPVHPVGMLIFSAPIQSVLWLGAWVAGAPLEVTDPGFLPIRLIIEKLTASFLATISVYYLFMTLEIFVPRRASLAISGLYMLGSSSLSTLSQGIWQHTGINLILMYLAHFLLQKDVPIARSREWMFFIALGMLCGIRPTAIPFVGIFVVTFIFLLGPPRISSLVMGFLILLPNIVWNVMLFQHILGGYKHFAYRRVEIDPFRCLVRLKLILFSPQRGLLTFNPFLVFLLWSYRPMRELQSKKRVVLVALAVCIVSHYLLCSTNPEWHGGYTFGPRYMLDVLAPSFLLAGIGFNSMHRRFPRTMKATLAVLAVFSVALHVLGVMGDRLPSSELRERYQKLLVP